MPLFTTIVLSKTVSDSVTNPAPRPSGYRLDLSVSEAVNIINKIFVMQREIQSPSSTDYENTFYSVASVADLEELPLVPTTGRPFYLTNSISLIFRTMNELQQYAAEIENLVQLLAKDNDLVINSGDPTMLGFPRGHTLMRYYGLLQTTTATDENLRSMRQDEEYNRDLDVEFTSDAPHYIYFAYRNELGAPTEFRVDGVDEVPVLVTRNVISDRGYSHSYRIYRSTNTFVGLHLNLHVK